MSEEKQNTIKKHVHHINELLTSIEDIYKAYLKENQIMNTFEELGMTKY